MTQTLPGPPSLPTNRGGCPFDPPAELRARPPVSRLSLWDGTVGWLVTSHSLARTVLADPRFSVRNELRTVPIRRLTAPPAEPGMFVALDPPDHTHYRRLLTGQFTVRRMNRMVPRIQEITEEHLDAMRRAGPPVDLVQAFALPIPSLVICELLGVPYAERDRFQAHSAQLLRIDTELDEIEAAADEIREFMSELVAKKRAHPSDDLLSGLIEGGELNDGELTVIGLLLLIAGHETTANMLSLGTLTLLRNPTQLAALRSDPTLVDNAVEELLRYLTVIQFGLTRAALEDVELDGVTIKAGESVTISLPAANRDSARFPDPDELDLTRPTAGHMAFGHGIHQCLGQQLARIEMRIGYAALLRRFPTLRLAAPVEDIPLRDNMIVYGAHHLPVTW
jgi:cytochrome P450